MAVTYLTQRTPHVIVAILAVAILVAVAILPVLAVAILGSNTNSCSNTRY